MRHRNKKANTKRLKIILILAIVTVIYVFSYKYMNKDTVKVVEKDININLVLDDKDSFSER